jgi:hypothetical protein
MNDKVVTARNSPTAWITQERHRQKRLRERSRCKYLKILVGRAGIEGPTTPSSRRRYSRLLARRPSVLLDIERLELWDLLVIDRTRLPVPSDGLGKSDALSFALVTGLTSRRISHRPRATIKPQLSMPASFPRSHVAEGSRDRRRRRRPKSSRHRT